MKAVINILLTIVIIVLVYLLYESIMDPIRFNKERDKREAAIKERLIDIRSAQVLFRSKYGKYTGSFDTLIGFIKNDSLPVVYRVGALTDEMVAKGLTEKEAIKQKLIIRDTSFVVIGDSLFKINYPIDSIRYVPFAGGEQFQLAAAAVETGSKVVVQLFEASVLNDVFLKGLDKQLIINYNALRKELTGFSGMRVGNVTEPNNNAGNWEN
ncbi:MAG: hypothetical protein IH591_01035 [Bacteroidales bacterium]|nr:hypothetical protein [Bacteroidales bacterium]